MGMTSTADTIQRLEKFKAEIKASSKSEIVTFNVEDISIEKDKMTVDGEQLSENATKKVLSHLRVKNNFLALSETMGSTDWANVREALKKPTGTQIVHGRKVPFGDGTVIDDIYMAAPKASGVLESDLIFGEIIDSIVSTGKDISLKSTAYLEDKDEIVVTLIDNDVTLDIFGNEKELWKIGKRIVWNGMNFSIFAFYERVECGSGVTVPRFGFKSNISNNKFNIEKFKQVLEKEITLNSQDLDSNLIDSINHLKSMNISVREFGKHRALFNEVLHSEIIKKWFDESKMNKSYGCIANDMPGVWRITADSGINALDFFKELIYIASHPEEATPADRVAAPGEELEIVKLTPREKYDIEMRASDILFKNELDLETIAPKLKTPATTPAISI